MRALVVSVVMVALGLAAPLASAEPAKAQSKKKAPAAAKKKAQKPAAPGVSLGSMAQAAAGSEGKADAKTPNGARRLDLTPSRLFGKTDPSGKRGKEKGSGLSLGDDTSWQTQAIQVGAIAAGFAALVAICGSGNCMLPWGGSREDLGPPPDLQIRPDNEPRPAR